MAEFSIKKPIKLIVKGSCQSVIPNAAGIPIAVNQPAVVLDLKPGVFKTDDVEVIERIRRDAHYNIIEGIMEITEEEREALNIRAKKEKEADVEIKEAKIRRKTKTSN